MQADEVKRLIEAGLPECKAFVAGDDGQHFSAQVVSPAFRQKSRVQQQQLVYQALADYIADGRLHAISIKTYTPEAWELSKA